jgi:hypothetical protein
MATPDRVDQLLAERERDYQGALQAARNDLVYREKLHRAVMETYGVNMSDAKLLEALGGENSKTRRARRDVVSEGSYLFEDDVRNYAAGVRGQSDITNNVLKTETNQRQISQPVPGTEAHHPASVSSTESLVQNMSEAEVRKLWDIAKKKGYTVGSQAEGFIPLSKPAHTTGSKNWGPNYAHVGADGKTPDSGRFKTAALPKETTAEQAWSALKPILDEQRKLNTKAFNHPTERRMRATVQSQYPNRMEWSGPVTPQRQAQRNALKIQGVNATTISKVFDLYPQTKKGGLIPGVNIMTNIGASHRGLAKPAKPPRRAPAASKPNASRADNSPLGMLKRMVNSTSDALRIHPGMSLPSVNLIQGI